MKTHMCIMDLATRAAVTVALLSAALSMKMAIGSESAGTFKEGQDVGKRNGALIAARVHQKVISRQGCKGLAQFQRALDTVTARVRVPGEMSSEFTAGFLQGYVQAIRKSIKDTRHECGSARFDDGGFAGEFFGNVFCQLSDQAPEALGTFAFGPIYEGWSGGDQIVKDGCAAAFEAVAGECATGIALQLLTAAQDAACTD